MPNYRFPFVRFLSVCPYLSLGEWCGVSILRALGSELDLLLSQDSYPKQESLPTNQPEGRPAREDFPWGLCYHIWGSSEDIWQLSPATGEGSEAQLSSVPLGNRAPFRCSQKFLEGALSSRLCLGPLLMGEMLPGWVRDWAVSTATSPPCRSPVIWGWSKPRVFKVLPVTDRDCVGSFLLFLSTSFTQQVCESPLLSSESFLIRLGDNLAHFWQQEKSVIRQLWRLFHLEDIDIYPGISVSQAPCCACRLIFNADRTLARQGDTLNLQVRVTEPYYLQLLARGRAS